MHREDSDVLSHGESVLIRNSDGSPATWTMDFREKTFMYICKLTVDEKVYRGLSSTPERAMKNAVNRYLRVKVRT